MEPTDRSDLPTPALMRAARGAYARSIRAQLHEIGIDDMPRNGGVVLTGIDYDGGPPRNLATELGVSKQALSQLIDVLADRGYVTRTTDADDRRRIALELTERGHEVVDAVQRGVDAVDHLLAARATAEQVEALRAGLGILADIKSASLATGAGRRRPARQLRRFEPIFPVRDLAAALAHYTSLGFKTSSYDGGEEYGFAQREGTGLHLSVHHDHDPAHHGGSAYLYVRDADALYEEWARPGVGGYTHPVEPTPWKLREGSHTDPDGNVIRFGSFIEEEEAEA
ncbi:MAG TPA: MarR family transcriptional regulator [Streptosporangiaceae bacterium]